MSTLRETFMQILEDNIEGMSKEEAKYYITNDAIPESGSVSGLIMYTETELIARDHYAELMELIEGIHSHKEGCPSLNDLVWMGWSVMLPRIADEVLGEICIEISVPHSMIVAFSQMTDGIWMVIYEHVADFDDQKVDLETEAASDVETLTKELQAYIFYNIDREEDMDAIEKACEEIEEAYSNDEEYVLLVSKNEN